MGAAPWLAAQAYAHRGLHGAGVPENTRGAFAAAIERGFGIELDVQLSLDGAAVVFHDDDLNRLAGVDAPVASKTAAELARLPILGTAERMATLPDTFSFIADRMPVLVEIKNERSTTGAIEEAVAAAFAAYPGRAAVMSWNVASIAWFARHHPQTPRGLVVTSFWRSGGFSPYLLPRLAAVLPPELTADPHFLAYDIRCLPTGRSERFRRKGRPVLTWTVRSEREQERARRYADRPIFEDLSRLAASIPGST
jgi:glycerophosphoryl diester phosphodiesterase